MYMYIKKRQLPTFHKISSLKLICFPLLWNISLFFRSLTKCQLGFDVFLIILGVVGYVCCFIKKVLTNWQTSTCTKPLCHSKVYTVMKYGNSWHFTAPVPRLEKFRNFLKILMNHGKIIEFQSKWQIILPCLQFICDIWLCSNINHHFICQAVPALWISPNQGRFLIGCLVCKSLIYLE